MSYEEKGAWVYLAAAVLTYLGYVAVVLVRAGGGPVDEVAYVAPMLWAIGISIALTALGRVGVEVARPSERHQPDVRDRDILRHGEYVGFYVLGYGLLPAFALTLAEVDHFWIANAIYLAFIANAVTSSVVKLVAYRRGL